MSTMRLDTQAQVDAAERTLKLAWFIVFGAVLFSVLTVTPLVERVTPDRWDWTAPILPLVVDAAVIIVVRVDSIVARLDGRPGGWPALLRWLTGVMTLALNVGDSALNGDLVGVGVHMVAPILLIVTAEASLKWRRAITTAVSRIEREHAEERERAAEEERAREERARADRQAAEAAEERRREHERADREREHEQAARLAREQRDHQAQMEREARDHAAQLAREERDELARQQREAADRAERIQRQEHERAERERKAKEAEKEAAERAERERKAAAERQRVAAAVSAGRKAVSAPVSKSAHEAPSGDKMTEKEARAAVLAAVREGRTQRHTAVLTGWSTGWIAARFREAQEAVSKAQEAVSV